MRSTASCGLNESGDGGEKLESFPLRTSLRRSLDLPEFCDFAGVTIQDRQLSWHLGYLIRGGVLVQMHWSAET